jgi:hypothetical protein
VPHPSYGTVAMAYRVEVEQVGDDLRRAAPIDAAAYGHLPHKDACVACGAAPLVEILAFGASPLADRLLREDQLARPDVAADPQSRAAAW